MLCVFVKFGSFANIANLFVLLGLKFFLEGFGQSVGDILVFGGTGGVSETSLIKSMNFFFSVVYSVIFI